MKFINQSAIFFLIIIAFSCKKQQEYEYIYPKEYLPAFPGSYWDYSNGERVLTSNEYVLHQYEKSISSSEKTDEKYVPVYNGQYLYEYSVKQNSTVYPLKQLLDERIGKTWEVNKINNKKVMRKVVQKLNQITIPFPYGKIKVDSVIKDILVVVEFLQPLREKKWNTKEYYAKSIGLIKVEINNPYDNNPPVLQKQIENYKINK